MAATRAEILRLLEQLEGSISAAHLASVLGIKNRARIAELERAINANDIDAIMRAAGYRPGAWNEVSDAVRQAYIEGGTFTMNADIPSRLGADFDWFNPRAERWLSLRSSRFITLINNEQREAVREVLTAGVNAGRNPRSIALDIVGRIDPRTQRRTGGIVGLNGPQTRAAMNARAELENLDPNYFNRKRRDRRFDARVRRAIENDEALPDADINRLVGRYEDRLLELRGTTIGRTEALAALNEASDESLRQVVEEGIVPPEAVKRVWVHSGNDNERPGHLALSGTPVGIGEPWVNPETGAQLMHPGDGPASEVINCRCSVRHEIDFFMGERAA